MSIPEGYASSTFAPDEPTTTDADAPSRRTVAVPYSGIRRERVEFLVPGRVPLDAVSLLAGEPGLGKTLLTEQYAAQLSRRGIASLLLSAEDSEGATIRPRLDACNADTELVYAVRLTDETAGDGLALPRDIGELDALIVETGAQLVVIDPVVAYLDAGIDSHKDASVRQALAPLARVAAERGCAVLAVMHVNKATGSDWYRRLSGSGGFGGAARSVLLFGRDPDDEDGERGTGRLLAHAKCNVGELAPSQRWRVAPILLPAAGLDPETRTARLELVGESDHGYRALLATEDPDERLPRDEAEEFLAAELADGPRPTKDIQRAARDAGIAPRTLERARQRLGVKSEREGFGQGAHYNLRLPNAWSATPENRQPRGDGWRTMDKPSVHADLDASETAKTPIVRHVSKVAEHERSDTSSRNTSLTAAEEVAAAVRNGSLTPEQAAAVVALFAEHAAEDKD